MGIVRSRRIHRNLRYRPHHLGSYSQARTTLIENNPPHSIHEEIKTCNLIQLPRPASVKLLVKMLRTWPGSGEVSTSIRVILILLHKLDCLYRSDSLAEYEQCWQEATKQVETIFPGFTVAYAEIYTAGQERKANGGMHHVLLPQGDHIHEQGE